MVTAYGSQPAPSFSRHPGLNTIPGPALPNGASPLSSASTTIAPPNPRLTTRAGCPAVHAPSSPLYTHPTRSISPGINPPQPEGRTGLPFPLIPPCGPDPHALCHTTPDSSITNVSPVDNLLIAILPRKPRSLPSLSPAEPLFHLPLLRLAPDMLWHPRITILVLLLIAKNRP